ncbi:hypothetical protein SteCoe_34607 [Stentor coeruleus]|uniref:Uncharacterized protein n=1 Tax=Stentor coeruleus TaxID=5963 RepID=A0A1R2AUH0_9CILI|nr:hypothetical protein SteCoe_34607 [Stentor coeruleus]
MHHSKHWLSFFALEGLDEINECLNSLSSHNIIRISDIHLEHGRFSLLLLSRALNTYRKSYDTPIEVYRLDFPAHNYQEMIKISNEEPESYTKLANCFTYYTSGSYMNRLHPDNSISLHITSHLLTAVNVREPAPDTFYPSVSMDERIRNSRKIQAVEDLTKFLQVRYEELINDGRIYVDMIGSLPDENNFRVFLDKALFKAIELKILPEEFKTFGFRTHYWETEDLMKVVDNMRGKLELVSHKEVLVSMPQYLQYQQDNDIQAYAESFVQFWKKALEFSLKFHFKGFFTDLQLLEIISNLCNLILEEFKAAPPSTRANSHYLVLKKIA